MFATRFFARATATTAALALLIAMPVNAQVSDALAFSYEAPTARTAASSVPVTALSDDILTSLWTNPSPAAALTLDPARSTADFARFALATTAATGAYASHEILGSAPADQGRTYTYARVHFEDASVLIRLTWADTTLLTVTRGAEPALPPALARN